MSYECFNCFHTLLLFVTARTRDRDRAAAAQNREFESRIGAMRS